MIRLAPIRLAGRLARRELRGGVRGFRIVLACLALGVAAIAGVGSLREGIARGLAEEGTRLLGGDLEVDTGANAVPDDLRSYLAARGGRISELTMMRALLVTPAGERQLVELKAVDPAWPLVGVARFEPPVASFTGGVVVEAVVLNRHGLKPGDLVRLGNATLTLHGALTQEPDSVSSPLLAPRALMALTDLPATGLDVPGALVRHAVRVVLPVGENPVAFAAALRQKFADRGWRIRDPSAAAPGISRVIEQTSQFMTLVGLTALLVGGIGVANGVRAWLLARAKTLATLRCLGASSGLVLTMCLIQVLGLAVLGTLIGLVLGAVLPLSIALLPADLLPITPRLGLYRGPLMLAAVFGLLTAFCFALPPLARAARIPGAALFRDVEIPAVVRAGWRILLVILGLAAALVALTVASTQDHKLAAWFCAGAVGALAALRLSAWGLVRGARALPRPHLAWARLGIGNLYRPGAPGPLLVVSVGLGLSTLAAVALIQGNLRAQVTAQIPALAPSFYFVDIQSDQLARFDALLAATKGVEEVRHVPSLRARIVAVNGVPAEQVRATPDTQWALRGDRGLTYEAAMPEGTRLTAGRWWPVEYRGPPRVSFDAALAAGWGVKLGDIIRVNVLGREIDLTVTSLRDIAWRSLGINFTMITSPGLLEQAPHTHIATVRAVSGTHGTLLRIVGDALPNVTGIRVEDVLRSVAAILDQLAVALAATGGITLIAGLLVLAGAVAAGQARRVREAVLLKTLGATRRQIRAAWLTEFGAIGLVAGLAAAVIGSASAWGVVRFVMHADFIFQPARLAAILICALVLLLISGYLGTASALRAKAAPVLRSE